ncbi:OmpA family protein [Pedobacter gandavensis]|uniref:OmpA family protein n=1 Tax=Pedobacter gandavensis TaxID=2679963 RepID=UPI00292E2C3B|nr:OmpA family protein [Pedobacter gandavensis]
MKTRLILFFIWSALFNSGWLFAQSNLERKGNSEYDKYAFINSREYYIQVAKKGKASDELLIKLGNSYYFNADYAQGAEWYGKLLLQNPEPSPEIWYRYALCLKSTGDYQRSDAMMEQFYKRKGEDYRARLFSVNRDYLKEIEMQSGSFEIEKAPFNSTSSDFAPMFYKDGLVISSNREKPGLEKNIHVWNNNYFNDLYLVDPADKGKHPKVRAFDKRINTKFHESTVAFTKDFNTIYFTRNNYFNQVYKNDTEGVNRLKLFRADQVSGKWVIKELPFNSDAYSVAHPSLSLDEKTLYFSSDMPGGYGQADIYKVAITAEGYGKPTNLGPMINTEGRETFPFISKSGKLFFSSDGHVGLGGLDVFVSEFDKDLNFAEAYNLGKPVNSKDDDLSFIIDDEEKTGYFASNRDNEVSDDDIYTVKKIKPFISKCVQFLEGTVKDSITNELLIGAKISLFDESNRLIATTYTDEKGFFKVDVELPCKKQYSLRAEKETYNSDEKTVLTNQFPYQNVRSQILLERVNLIKGTDLGKLLALHPIRFNLGKYDILPESEIELQKVINAMKLYPKLIIEVRSHTDSRASKAYNKTLSENRAKSTVAYIITKGGIDPARISGKGYGEEELLNRCADGVSCPEGDHAINRRSEFIIMKSN